MKIFFPKNAEDIDEDEDVNTSFTFDSKDEERDFCEWLDSLSMGYVKTKYRADNGEGKMVWMTCVVINTVVEEEEEEEAEEPEPEPVAEKKSRRKKAVEESE